MTGDPPRETSDPPRETRDPHLSNGKEIAIEDGTALLLHTLATKYRIRTLDSHGGAFVSPSGALVIP